MATIIIFASLLVLSLTVILFLVKRQVARIGSLPVYYLDGVDSAWDDLYQLTRGLFSKLWLGNAHRVEFLVVILGKIVIRFIVKIENFILEILNFIWGKCKIEKNNSSHYWQMMIKHKKDLSEDTNMGSKVEQKKEE